MNTETCENCHEKISWRVYGYSMNQFNKALCMNCQLDERKKKYPAKMADFINKTIKKEYGFG